jgi:hypothetical protein
MRTCICESSERLEAFERLLSKDDPEDLTWTITKDGVYRTFVRRHHNVTHEGAPDRMPRVWLDLAKRFIAHRLGEV